MKIFTTLLLLFLAISGCAPRSQAPATNEPVLPDATRQAVAQAILSIDQMRSGLSGTLDGSTEPVDANTFTQVCKPVGMKAKQVGEENGWEVRQVAVKNRNPANKADAEAADVSARFVSETGLDSLWIHTSINGTPGWRYLRRITVEPACLACHGEKENRPAFVKEKYPEDQAFGFEVGDLRGLYSVFVPDSLLAR